MSFKIAIKNFSTVVSDAEVQHALPAFQTQLTRDFSAAYGATASLRIAQPKEALKSGEWLLGNYDNADQAGALGYHDITSSGQPLGKVFAKTTKDDGGIWSVTFSHELLEMMADPWIDLTVLDAHTNRLYAWEVCDAVEADALGYSILGTKVSDFVLPAFFRRDTSAPAGTKLSFCGHVSRPFTLAPEGYLSFLDLGDVTAGWQQITARLNAASMVPAHPGTSRGARRRKAHAARGELVRSTAP